MNRRAQVGMPILLIVLGAIAALAIPSDTVEQVDLSMVGWILALAGVLWLAIELVNANRRRGLASERVTQVDPETGARRTRTEQELE